MSRADDILDQMAYLVDELEAQRAVIGLIPEVVWDSRPPGDAPSLREMYAAMLERERGSNRVDLGLDETPVPPATDPAGIIAALAAARTDTVSGLRAQPLSAGQLERCFAITQEDAESLRDISVRLHETSMGAPRVKAL